jgi:hypothetical protein
MRTHVDYHCPSGALTRANTWHEYLANYDFLFSSMLVRRFARTRIGELGATSTTFQGSSGGPVAGGVGSTVPQGESHPALMSASQWRSRTVVCEQDAEGTIDWVCTAGVGRNSNPSRGDGNTSDRGGGNG